MPGFFYQLGRKVGPKLRQATWAWHSLFGDEDQRLAAEAAVGQDLTEAVLKQMPALSTDTRTIPATSILQQLVSHLRDQRRHFYVFVISDKSPNAFALPGGTVIVTNSLLTLCDNSSDQMAFVLAHEMAHIIKGHAMERLAMNAAITTVTKLGTVRKSIMGWVQKVGVGALQGTYSQDHELEADALGIRLSRAAGYQAEAACQLLEALSRLSPTSSQEGLKSYFSSHPPLARRLSEIQRVLQN
ncbi:M48 family metallopeptidase [Planctomycetota bacterium]